MRGSRCSLSEDDGLALAMAAVFVGGVVASASIARLGLGNLAALTTEQVEGGLAVPAVGHDSLAGGAAAVGASSHDIVIGVVGDGGDGDNGSRGDEGDEDSGELHFDDLRKERDGCLSDRSGMEGVDRRRLAGWRLEKRL
jgi:hypothetical protein